MNIRKQIDEVIEGLSPGECIEALGIMIIRLARQTADLRGSYTNHIVIPT